MFAGFRKKWPLDRLADEIQSSLKQALPSAAITEAFYEEGVRHGKKRIPEEGIQELIKNAVEVATNKLAEEFLDARRQATNHITGLEGRIATLESVVAAALSQTGTTPRPTAPSPTGDPELEKAADLLRARNAEKAAAAAAAELAARKEQLELARQQLLESKQDLEELPTRYRQLVETCQETGEFLWNRYLNGYDIGAARRGNQDGPPNDPTREIEFDYPEALRARTPGTDMVEE